MVRGAKALSHALYLPRRMERAAQIARNNYPFLQPKHLELLVEVNMASRPKHEWSALQSVFTAPKFRATAGDALNFISPSITPSLLRRKASSPVSCIIYSVFIHYYGFELDMYENRRHREICYITIRLHLCLSGPSTMPHLMVKICLIPSLTIKLTILLQPSYTPQRHIISTNRRKLRSNSL
jgi:hypothetical protein